MLLLHYLKTGNNQTYGGNDANDNSGNEICKSRIRRKKNWRWNFETNTMTFYAVGAGTILENLVAYKGTDDGFI